MYFVFEEMIYNNNTRTYFTNALFLGMSPNASNGT